MDWLDELNEQQLQAVLSTEGPLLVLAGAGSGKTRVITYRIAYLIKECGVSPNNILAITFTNKAADEMKERIRKIVGLNIANEMWISTFHAACARILRIESNYLNYSSNFTIYDMSDRETVLKDCIKELKYDSDMLRFASRKISELKNNFVLPEDFERFAEDFREKRLVNVYKLYNKMLKENHAMDFDDLILNTILLFKKNTQILEKYQNKFQYILVDEYQDTNQQQAYLVNLLASKYRNICVVGDDDQSIYSFRGADVGNILSFEKAYPNCKVIKLEKNYRSTKNILTIANEVIKNNKLRKSKTLWTNNEIGEKIKLYEAYDENDEADFVVKQINEFVKNGIKPSQIAILYRTNAQSLYFEKNLALLGLPYKIIGSYKFFDRKEVKDLIAFLRVLINPRDNYSLLRIVNIPKRGIGTSTIEKLKNLSIEHNMAVYDILLNSNLFGFEKRTNQKFEQLIGFLEFFKNESDKLTVSDILKLIVEKTNYLGLDDDSIDNMDRIKNIEEVISSAKIYEEQQNDRSIDGYLNSISLMSDLDDQQKDERISLLTIHSAKGLEFDIVFLVGLEEGLFPSIRTYDQLELEEERRLFYVAVTRAKKDLFLTYALSRRNYGKLDRTFVSRFVSEIPKKYVNRINQIVTCKETINNNLPAIEKELSIGDVVEHPKFGIGIVENISIDNSEIEINFNSFGLKRLIVGYAKLKRIG